jgi:hypothetical protein
MSDDPAGLGLLEVGALAAERAIHGLESSLESLSQIGGDAGETLGGLGHAIADLSSGDIVGMLTNLHQAAESLATMSDEADRQTRAIAALGDGMDAISRQTADTVDETDAYRMQQRLLTSDLHATGEELGNVAGFAREWALAHGTTAAEATERLTSALIRGSQGGLRPFGIEVEHGATRSQAFHSALDQMGTSLAQTGVSARTAGEDVHRFDRELGDSVNDLGRTAAAAIHLQGIFRALTETIHGMQGAVSGDAQTRERAAAAAGLYETSLAVDHYNSAMINARHTLSGFTEELPRFDQLSRQSAESLTRALQGAHSLDEARAAVAQARSQTAAGQAAAAAAAREAAENEALDRAYNDSNADALGRTPTTHHRGGAAHAHRIAGVAEAERAEAQERATAKHQALAAEIHAQQEAYDEQERAAVAFNAFMDALDTEAANHQTHQAARAAEKAMLQEGEAEQRRLIEQQIELVHHVTAAEHVQIQSMSLVQLARLNDVRHAQSYAEQMKSVYEMLAGGTESSAQRMSGAIKGQLSSMEGAFEQHLGAIIEGNENAGEALKKFTHTVMLQTAVKATVLSAEEFAAGFAMVARAAGSYGADVGAESSASGHFIAGGIYAGIAGGSAAGAYATNPSKSAGGGSSSVPSMASRASYGAANDNGHGGGGNTYVTIEGSIIDTASFDRHVNGAQERNWGSRQVPGYQRTGS